MTRLLMTSGCGLSVVGLGVWLGTLSGAEIELRSRCETTSSMLTLRDLAVISAETEAEATELGNIEICPAPSPGRHKQLLLTEIRERLTAVGARNADLVYRGNSRVIVHRPAPKPASKATAKTPAKFSPLAMPTPKPDKIVPVAAVVPSRTTVTTGSTPVKTTAPQQSSSRPRLLTEVQQRNWETRIAQTIGEQIEQHHPELRGITFEVRLPLEAVSQLAQVTGSAIEVYGGQFPLERPQTYIVRYLDEQGRIQSLQVTAQAAQQTRIVAAACDLPTGTILQTQHLAIRPMPRNAGVATGSVVDPQTLLGQRIRRTMKAGTTITTNDVEQQQLVRSGDLVTLLVRRSGITIRMPAKSQAAGTLGEAITVTALDRRDVFAARIVGNQLVELIGTTAP